MIPLFKVVTDNEACLKNVKAVLDSGYIGEGTWVEDFENALAKEWETSKRVLTVNSCTSALELAMHMCDVRGKYVITTPQTCTATNTAILSRGGKILWADVDMFTGNISPTSVYNLIDKHGKENIAAVVCVDWGGHAVDYDQLRLASQGLPIIEDAAHSYLTRYKGRHISDAGGDYVCFSFQAIKHLTTVDGGALIVPKGQEKRAELLRWYGLDRKSSASFRCSQTVHEAGFKFHMNNVSAAIGLANMHDAALSVSVSQTTALFYSEQIRMSKGVIYNPTFDEESSYWLYTILVNDRDNFIAYMKENGVDTSPVHARNDKHPCFPPRVEGHKGIDYFSSHNVSIPCGKWLSINDLEKITDLVNAWKL